MHNMTKTLYFKLVRKLTLRRKVAVLCFLLALAIPINLFHGGGGHWLELVKHAEGKAVREILKIYSVLKANRTDMNETSVWAIAQTIMEESKKHSLDPMLVLAVIKVESQFQDSAISALGARGLMQIRPFVADSLAEEVEWQGERNLDDPILNIKLGVFYLSHLKKRFRVMELALAAYNSGPTEVRGRLEEQEEVPLEYATKVLSTYSFYRNGQRHIKIGRAHV